MSGDTGDGRAGSKEEHKRSESGKASGSSSPNNSSGSGSPKASVGQNGSTHHEQEQAPVPVGHSPAGAPRRPDADQGVQQEKTRREIKWGPPPKLDDDAEASAPAGEAAAAAEHSKAAPAQRDGRRSRDDVHERSSRDYRDRDRSPGRRDRDRSPDRRDRDRRDDGDEDRDKRTRGREHERGRDRGGDRDGLQRDSSRERGEGGSRKRPLDDAAPPPAAADDAKEDAEPVQRKPVNTGKTGGVYIPPFKLARMMQEVTDRSSPEYQKLTWEALKKSLNGLVNKVNTNNIKHMLPEVFKENLERGKGLFCRSLMKSQMASPSFSAVYSALVAVVNARLPAVGRLLLTRLVLQFKRAFKRNDKPVCAAALKFIAHLVNQGVASDMLAFQMITLLLTSPTEDSVELAVEFTKEVGQLLHDAAPEALRLMFDTFRDVLQNGSIGNRGQYIVEALFSIRRAGFAASEHPTMAPELDLIEDEDRLTHLDITLETEGLNAQVSLDVFTAQEPEAYETAEQRWAAISKDIVGAESSADEEDGEGSDDGSGDDASDDEDGGSPGPGGMQQDIQDATGTNLVNLRRTIYLTLMSSANFEEAGHKLMKIQVSPGQEIEIVTMILECCSQERTYKRFFGLLAQRFCYINRTYQALYEDCFRRQYSIIHRLETNKLRNVASMFAHLLATDAIAWEVLSVIRLTEDDTTSSSRIFIKYLFQELSATMGLVKLNLRLNDPECAGWFDGIFPKDSLANMRFSINFYTSIGLGGVTDSMRDLYKKTVAEQAAAQQRELMAQKAKGSDSSSSDSSSSDSDSSSSDSDSSSSSSSSSSDSDSGDPRRRRKGSGRRKDSKGKAKDHEDRERDQGHGRDAPVGRDRDERRPRPVDDERGRRGPGRSRSPDHRDRRR